MRKIYLPVLLFFISIKIFPLSGWFLQPSGTDQFLWDMDFINQNTGFIGGDGGRILKTTNGGTNWVISIIDPSVNFVGLDLADASTGYAAGTGGKMYKTTNTGLNWFQITTPSSSSIQKIKFIDGNTGFFVGGVINNGEIFRTTNGGINWIQYGPGAVYSIGLSISFPSNNTGFVSCYDGKILKSTNNGINWSILNTGLTGGIPVFSVYFPDNDTGFAVNSQGEIVKTENSGVTWNDVYSDTTYGLVNTFFINGLTGFAIGGRFEGGVISQLVLRTNNGGVNWYGELLPNFGHLNCIVFTDLLTGYISCQNGLIYKTTNGGNPIGIKPVSSEIPQSFKLFQNYPNPFNPETKIMFRAAEFEIVRIDIFDAAGRLAGTIVNESLRPGTYEAIFNGSNLSSSVYYYKLTAGKYSETKKMIVLK